MSPKHALGLAAPFFILALIVGVSGCLDQSRAEASNAHSLERAPAAAITWTVKTVAGPYGRRSFVTLEPSGCVYLVAGEELIPLAARDRFGNERLVGCRPGGFEALSEALANIPETRVGC